MLYINIPAAQASVNMMSGETAITSGRHREPDSIMTKDSGDCEDLLARFTEAETKRKDFTHDHTRRAAH
jgi:hypothetical protein